MGHRFYDELSAFYHLIYPDWEASIAAQAQSLDAIIRRCWGEHTRRILDVSCGIGTQCLGLAALGYRVTGSDVSEKAVARARREAAKRGLGIALSVCDMREVYALHASGFDVVLCADNSITHLQSDEEILAALASMRRCLRPGGGCLITVRAYDQETRGTAVVKPHGVREEGGTRYLLWQVWDFTGEHYDLTLYVVEDDGMSAQAKTHVMRSRYYAIAPNRIAALMVEAGFDRVERLDEMFFQPVLVGTRAA